MNDGTGHLNEAVARAPQTPGCYLWKDGGGDILYVGKAIRLRSRLKSYLNPADERTDMLMRQVRELEWITTATGSEALILEANLIKEHRPRFNVRLKDDKSYPYLCVSTGEAFPRLFITREIRRDGHRYFGPYSDVRAVRNTLALLHRIFPIRKTPLRLPLKKPRRPCMNYHIGRCLGPCRGDVTPDDYRPLIEEIILFLEGKREILENRISQRMTDFSGEQNYEKAALYRDMLFNVRRVTERQSVMNPEGGDEDLVAFAVHNDEGQIVVLEVRDGRLLGRKSFPLVGTQKGDEQEILSSFLRDYYPQADELPARIILPVVLRDRREFLEYFEKKRKRRIRLLAARSPRQRGMIALAEKNAALLLKERLLTVRLRDRRLALEELATILKLERPPEIIECYDISHTQGTAPVAAGVMFVDGNPHRSGYRRYAIKYTTGIDDPAMIEEVIVRRLQRLAGSDTAFPDLIVIDGGRTQLEAACRAAQALEGENIPIIALAKKFEEIYLPGAEIPLRIDSSTPALKMLRHIRDEAHRYGLAYHRRRRNIRTMEHMVEKIPDIGPRRRRALLHHFQDRKISQASAEELASVPGIGDQLAGRIVDFFKNQIESGQNG